MSNDGTKEDNIGKYYKPGISAASNILGKRLHGLGYNVIIFSFIVRERLYSVLNQRSIILEDIKIIFYSEIGGIYNFCIKAGIVSL